MGFISAQHEREPFGVGARMLVDFVEVVTPFGVPMNTAQPRDQRAMDAAPLARLVGLYRRIHRCTIPSAKVPRSRSKLSAPYRRTRLPFGKIDRQVALTLLDAWDLVRKALEIVPGVVFRLCIRRADVAEAPVGFLAAQCCIDQIHDAGDGLAGTTMSDDAGPALFARMERGELGSRDVAEINL